MLHMIEPRLQTETQYHDAVVELYQALAGEQGKIAGYRVHMGPGPAMTDSSAIIGVKPLLRFFASINYAFPQYELTLENLVTKGEKVMVKYSIRGVQKGKFMGMEPRSEKIGVSGLDIFRLDQGRVVEYWMVNHQIEKTAPNLRDMSRALTGRTL